MKTYLIALAGSLLLAGTALAEQCATSVGTDQACAAGVGQECGCPRCCGARCNECVVAPATKKNEKVNYSMKCVDFCVKGFPGLGNHTCKDCKGCEVQNCPTCGKVRTKKVLIKKVKVTECDTFKCVPQTVCDPAGGVCH